MPAVFFGLCEIPADGDAPVARDEKIRVNSFDAGLPIRFVRNETRARFERSRCSANAIYSVYNRFEVIFGE